MAEFFACAVSNPAPIFADFCLHFVSADSPEDAVHRVLVDSQHIAGLQAVRIYAHADDYHRGSTPLITWMSQDAHKAEEERLCG